ncbi:MAG: LysM peptidoglycan-binding domain-containing protein [Pseudomonadota bacterium]
MRRFGAWAKLSSAAMIAALATGCGGVSTGGLPFFGKKEVAPAEPECPVRPGLTASERLLEARSFLNDGQYAPATCELKAAQQAANYTGNARQLETIDKFLDQLELSPLDFFAYEGGRKYSYTVRRNEGLANIAQNQLGDATLFVALARFNDLARPGDLSVGQVIQIPGEPPRRPTPIPARSADEPDAPDPRPITPPERLALAREALAGDDHLTALSQLTVISTSGLSETAATERNALLAQAQCVEADRRASASAQTTARALIACARPMADAPDPTRRLEALAMASDAIGLYRSTPGGSELVGQLRGSLQSEAQSWMIEASRAMADYNYKEAATLAEKVVLVDPDNATARQLLENARRYQSGR